MFTVIKFAPVTWNQLMMAKILMTFIFLMGSSFAASYQCTQDLVSEPPFYVSDEYQQGDKLFENFRNIENPDKKDRYIPRGSIVFVDPELYEQYGSSKDGRVPVRVLTTPSKKTEDALRSGTKKRKKDDLVSVAAIARGQKRVKENDKGWMSLNSLRQSDKYTFAVEKDSLLYQTPGIDANKSYYIRLNMQGGKFKVQNCCTTNLRVGQQSKCLKKYEMTVIDENNNSLQSNYVNFRQCNFFEGSLPIENDLFAPFKGILDNFNEDDEDFKLADLEVIPAHQAWNGTIPRELRKELVKMPLDKYRRGPFGSFHYLPDDKSNSDAYLKPNAMCAFTQVLKKWEKECTSSGCKVMFGNLYHPVTWGTHKSHVTGACVDIRPFRRSDDKTSGGLTHKSGRYSRDKTKKFVQLLEKAGGKKIFFNDPGVYGSTSASKLGGHDNHIHVCFPEKAAQTLRTCKNGL